MNLVFKNLNQAGDPSKPFLFKDRRVNEGTLFCIDFSNEGALVQSDLSKGITDLADDVPLRGANEITTFPQIAHSLNATIPELTDKKGMPMTFLGTIDNGMYNTGIRIKGVGNYLYEKQPSAIFLVWMQQVSGVANPSGGSIIRAAANPSGGGTLPTNFQFYHPGAGQVSVVSMSLGTKSGFVNRQLVLDTPTQLAIVRTSATEPCRLFVNGQFVGVGPGPSSTFGAPLEDDITAIGGVANNNTFRNPSDLFHVSLHDLSLVGMSADDFIVMDYEYVNGIGQFEGLPTRRPYANLPI